MEQGLTWKPCTGVVGYAVLSLSLLDLTFHSPKWTYYTNGEYIDLGNRPLRGASMNGLLQHSNLCFASLQPPSVLSSPSPQPSSTYTVEGIGTASGRVIYAVGAITLKGIELLAKRRKLSIAISFFPRKNNDDMRNIEAMYDYVLEFSRQVQQSIQNVLHVYLIECSDLVFIAQQYKIKRCRCYQFRSQTVKLVIFLDI
jgi:hypothetical protein